MQKSTERQLPFDRSKGHGSGCTTVLSGMHCHLYRVLLSNTAQRPPPCAVTIHKTCIDPKWNGYQNSARMQDKMSMCWQCAKHFDLSPGREAIDMLRHGANVCSCVQRVDMKYKASRTGKLLSEPVKGHLLVMEVGVVLTIKVSYCCYHGVSSAYTLDRQLLFS